MSLQRTFSQDTTTEAGCDEAGRGCLAGPIVAAAVILPADFFHPSLNDSKKMTPKQRETLFPIIQARAVAWGIGIVDHREVDRMNCLNASFEAMHRAIEQLSSRPELLLIDGNRFLPFSDIPHQCIVKGDERLMPIAAASVLAKVERDNLMRRAHLRYPHYGWDSNKGYPTQKHRAAIAKHGRSPLHRNSFKLL